MYGEEAFFRPRERDYVQVGSYELISNLADKAGARVLELPSLMYSASIVSDSQ